MEECLICLEEKNDFIVFSCNHKICNECFPVFLMYSVKCPLCNKQIIDSEIIEIDVHPEPIQIQIQRPNYRVQIQICKLWFGIITILGGIIYITYKNESKF